MLHYAMLDLNKAHSMQSLQSLVMGQFDIDATNAAGVKILYLAAE